MDDKLIFASCYTDRTNKVMDRWRPFLMAYRRIMGGVIAVFIFTYFAYTLLFEMH